MTKPQEKYMDLAWGLLYDTLSPEERALALRLAASEPAFLEALQLELALKKELTKLKTPIPEGVKLRVYAKIRGTMGQALYRAVLRTVLETTMPKMLGWVMQIFERSVFVSE